VEKANELGYITVDPQSVILTHFSEAMKKHFA
jgi:flagellar biosynthesis component FlhA